MMSLQIKFNKILVGLALIVMIGGLLRVHRLSTESIWFDEGLSIYGAMHSSMFVDPEDLNPPFYYFLLHHWINIFGKSEFSVRFPSVIFNVLSIIIIFKIGKVLFDAMVGLISSLLLSLSWYHVAYAKEARSYSLMILLTLYSFYFLIRLSEKRNLRTSIAYLMVSCLLMYTHTYGIFLIIAQNIWFITLILFSKDQTPYNIKNWILLQAILGLLYFPWVHFLFAQVSKFNTLTFIKPPTFSTVLTVFTHYAGSTLALLVFFIIIIIPLQKVIIKTGLKNYLRDMTFSHVKCLRINALYLLLLWTLIPNVIPFILSYILHPFYYCRYTISASLGFYILIAVAVNSILSKPVRSGIVVLLLVLSLYNITKYYRFYAKKQEWREVAAYVDSNAYPQDLIVFSPGFTQRYVFDYYSTRTDLHKKPFPKESISSVPESARDITEGNLKELITLVEHYDRVWVIMAHHHDYKGIIKKTLEKRYNLMYQKIYYGGITTYLFRKFSSAKPLRRWIVAWISGSVPRMAAEVVSLSKAWWRSTSELIGGGVQHTTLRRCERMLAVDRKGARGNWVGNYQVQ